MHVLLNAAAIGAPLLLTGFAVYLVTRRRTRPGS